jgi:hypothetical protein
MLAPADLLATLLNRINNNDPHLNYLNWKDQALTDEQMRQLHTALLHNIFITEIELPVKMSNHANYSAIKEIVKKNRKAQQLLLVEQAIALAQGSRQASSLINRLPSDILVIIINILSSHIMHSAEKAQLMGYTLVSYLRSAPLGKLKWITSAIKNGKEFTFFKKWDMPSLYLENVIRYTRDYQKCIDEMPQLKEWSTSWFMLWMIKISLPELMQYHHNKSRADQKPLTKTKLFDIFIHYWFSQQAHRLKENNSITNEDEIKAEFWKYGTSLAQDMIKANLRMLDFEKYTLNNATRDHQLHRLWKKYFDTDNVRFAYCQAACLVAKTGPYQYAFVDNLILDYFFSCKQFENITGQHMAQTASNAHKRF